MAKGKGFIVPVLTNQKFSISNTDKNALSHEKIKCNFCQFFKNYLKKSFITPGFTFKLF